MAEGPYFVGVDGGTEGTRVGIFDRRGKPVVFAGEAYGLKHPKSGWAEQDPDEWWSCLVKAMRRALDEGNVPPEEIAGISVDATTCTVVAVDNRLLSPLRDKRLPDLVHKELGRPRRRRILRRSRGAVFRALTQDRP